MLPDTFLTIYLRNEFNFWNVHGIMNTWGLLQEAWFVHATQVWLAVNHKTTITSGERVRCSK